MSPRPYQPLLLRLLHGLNSLFALGAVFTAFWTYNTYDGRWGRVPLPRFPEIEGIHGTFGLWTLLLLPVFVWYSFHRGQKRLIQPDSFQNLTRLNQPMGWYSLHRITNTGILLALTFAVFTGKMMDETWLPKGELHHVWYSMHLLSWLIVTVGIALHLLMGAKVGGVPLLLSMLSWRWRSKDSPAHWIRHIQTWRWK